MFLKPVAVNKLVQPTFGGNLLNYLLKFKTLN